MNIDCEDVECARVEERKLLATRDRINELIQEGWSIVGRMPLLLARGSAKLEVRSNGIIVAG